MRGRDQGGPWLAIILGVAVLMLATVAYLTWLAGSRRGPITLSLQGSAQMHRPNPQPLPAPLHRSTG